MIVYGLNLMMLGVFFTLIGDARSPASRERCSSRAGHLGEAPNPDGCGRLDGGNLPFLCQHAIEPGGLHSDSSLVTASRAN